MGVFNFLFKKKRDQEQTNKVHNSLKTSFSNIKTDMLHLHKNFSNHTEHTSKRFQEIDERVRRMENLLLTLNHSSQNAIKETKIMFSEKEESEESEETEDYNDVLSLLKGIPKAELKLFKTLHDLQLSLNAKQVSYKSLASYLYPNKNYNSIRSTIAQFVLRLLAEGLVEKRRIGKEGHVYITSHGYKILKNTKMKKLMKEIEN